MSVYDRQDPSSSLNGVELSEGSELTEVFKAAEHRQPFFIELKGVNQRNLLVGLGETTGCVQLSNDTGEPPYLMATTDEPIEDDYTEFLIGDTPTPIPRRYCMPLEIVREVVRYFIDNGSESPSVKWEQV